MKFFLSLTILAALLTSCASNSLKKLPTPKAVGSMETATIERTIAENEIRPGYILSIRHSADKKLSGNFKVEWDGSLLLPYGKTFQTTDKTTELLAEELKETYSGLFRSGNSFSVSIANKLFAIEVRGLVKRPGILVIKEDTPLEEIIAKGEADREQVDYVRIELSGQSQWIDLKQYSSGSWPSEKMPKWFGGETIWFVRGDTQFKNVSADIRLMGEINQPGAYSFQNGKTVLDYLTMAGGLKTSANLERIYIYRPDGKTHKVAQFTLLEPQSFSLAPGDLLLIPSDRVDSTERKIQMGANLAAILSAIGVILLAL
jgi:protein involved in polysaccharide export with SLBB domain